MRRSKAMHPWTSWIAATLVVGFLIGANSTHASEKSPVVTWHTDYRQAMDLAEQQGRSLLVYYYQPGKTACGECFDRLMHTEKAVAESLKSFTCVKLPTSATIRVNGKDVKLLEHEAFSSLGGKPGMAILEMAHKDSPNYGGVINALPFDNESELARKVSALLCGISATAAQQKPRLAHESYWLTDYARGVQLAQKQRKLMLVYFRDTQPSELQQQFESESLSNPRVQGELADFVCVRVPFNATISTDGRSVRLLDTPSFAEMLGRPGIAIVDFAHRDAAYYGDVVSTFPLLERHPYTPDRLAEILALPPGTLTQRTMIYAVRVHAEQPQSTQGQLNTYLLEEAQSHSQYQAQIRVQGHHQWGSRFQRILGNLPLGLTASEVCAESWPGEHLVEAAIECVRCWRTSSGHWSKVSSPQPMYGYDMKLGSNGIWYATGIFGQGTLR